MRTTRHKKDLTQSSDDTPFWLARPDSPFKRNNAIIETN